MDVSGGILADLIIMKAMQTVTAVLGRTERGGNRYGKHCTGCSQALHLGTSREHRRPAVVCESAAHSRGCIKNFVQRWTAGSPVAVETVGNWYWVVDEIEAGGGKPQLVNARLAKLMIGNVNKSDKLDAKGMNMLQRTGTLPTVWIAPGGVRHARNCRALAWCLAGKGLN